MSRQRICIYGAGAVGGHFAVRLARAGHAVSVVVRGPALAAIRRRGLTLQTSGESLHAAVTATDEAGTLGEQDLVIVTLKAHALAAAAPLLPPAPLVVFAQNGIPWWYGHGVPVAPALEALRERSIGAVVQSSNTVVAPGVVANDSPQRNTLLVGEVGDIGDGSDDAETPRVAALRALLAGAGIGSPAVADIRRAVWRKLFVNFAGSPLCALTGRDATVVAQHAGIAVAFERLLHEALAIAAAHGHRFGSDEVDPAALRAAAVPAHKPSMLQDRERGRPLETDAILRWPQAFARAAGIATPVLDTVLALLDV